MLAVGKIAKPFGVQGWLKVLSYSGESGHFFKLKTVAASDATRSLNLIVEQAKEYQDGLVMKFRGYDSPEAARALCGLELKVARGQAAPCGQDEYYFADLVDCQLHYGGNTVAQVRGVLEGGASGFLLETVKPDGQSVLIPFQAPFIGTVDISHKLIELLAPWVLD